MAEWPLADDDYAEIFAACDLAAEARSNGRRHKSPSRNYTSPPEPLLLTNFSENPHARSFSENPPRIPVVTLPPSPQPFSRSEQPSRPLKCQWRQSISHRNNAGPSPSSDCHRGAFLAQNFRRCMPEKHGRGDDLQTEEEYWGHPSSKRHNSSANGNHAVGQQWPSPGRDLLHEIPVQNSRLHVSHEIVAGNVGNTWPDSRENAVANIGANGSWMTTMPTANVFKQFQEAALQILVPGDYMMMQGKPFIKKSGWRKIGFYFNISFEIKDKNIQFDPHSNVTRAEFVVRASMLSGRFSDGWGSCDRGEKRFSKPNHDIPTTAETRAKNRACQDLLGIGEYRVGNGGSSC